jgi:hypothetical protein
VTMAFIEWAESARESRALLRKVTRIVSSSLVRCVRWKFSLWCLFRARRRSLIRLFYKAFRAFQLRRLLNAFSSWLSVCRKVQGALTAGMSIFCRRLEHMLIIKLLSGAVHRWKSSTDIVGGRCNYVQSWLTRRSRRILQTVPNLR